MSRPRTIALLLAFATLLVFLPVGWHQFVNYDDVDYVTENPFVKNGLNWTDFKWAFTAFHAGNWHPLTWISHQLDCELFGLNAGAQHIVNVLFHSANAALVFILLLRLTEKLWPSAMVAALFAWHPLHVESVAWIAERKDVLSTLFALLALLSYTRYARKNLKQENHKPNAGLALPSFNSQFLNRDYFLSLIFFTLGLLSKPMLVTLPFAMLLLDFWPLQRRGFSSPIKLLVEKTPFFLLAGISCIVTFFAQGEAVVTLTRVPLHYRIEHAPIAVVDYVLNFFWPANLDAIYPLDRIFAWHVIISLAILIFISIIAWHWRKTKPYFIFGWLWFLGALVPVIGLVQVGSQSIADRYTYIPSIGFFTAFIFLAADFGARIKTSKIIIASSAVMILIACILATEFQLRFWRDSETLFRHAIAVRPDNVIALVDLGVSLDAQHRFDEALAIYRQAEKFETGPYYQLHNNLGNILSLRGNHAASLAEYGIAIHERPNDAFLHNAAGSEFAALGKFEMAMKEFAVAEQLNPNYAAPHLETAKVFLRQGRDADAVNELRAAVRLTPDDFQILAYTAHILAANENAAVRDGKSALTLAFTANDLSGHSQPMVFDAMGMACAELGDFTNAQACARNALDLGAALQMQNLQPISNRLELYKKNLPWRESFLATNLPPKN
jgi:protein O-mannosyl-transferase